MEKSRDFTSLLDVGKIAKEGKGKDSRRVENRTVCLGDSNWKPHWAKEGLATNDAIDRRLSYHECKLSHARAQSVQIGIDLSAHWYQAVFFLASQSYLKDPRVRQGERWWAPLTPDPLKDAIERTEADPEGFARLMAVFYPAPPPPVPQ